MVRFIVEGRVGLGHILRPRRNIFANQFARVDSLANCHWQFSPATPFWRVVNSSSGSPRKNRSFRNGLIVEGQVGLEPTTPCLKGRCSNRLSYWPTSAFAMEAGYTISQNKFPIYRAQLTAILPFFPKSENNSLYYPDFCKKINQSLGF